MVNKAMKLIVLSILTLFLVTFAGKSLAVVDVNIPKGTRALVQIDENYVGKNLKIGDRIEATLLNDVKVEDKTILMSGSGAYIMVANAEASHFAGNGGVIKLENGAVYYKNRKHMFDFNCTIVGKEKEWVKVTTSAGIVFFPLLFFGLVKGGEAKIPVNKVYEIEFNGYSSAL